MIKKTIRSLFSFFLAVISIFCLVGCSEVESEDLPANKWLSIDSAVGYSYDFNEAEDVYVNAKNRGFTTETMSNDDEWDTPYLRYSEIRLDVEKPFKILGFAFELKSKTSDRFVVDIEVQLYKELSLPSNWSELTDEAKMIWERENRIKDKQYDTCIVSDRVDAVSFSFDDEKSNLDTSYQIRIIFTSTIEEENILQNFAVDNFIVLTEK